MFANNGLSDTRSVSVTSVIWSECEPSITLRCALGQTISKYSMVWKTRDEVWTDVWGRYWLFIKYQISGCLIIYCAVEVNVI